MAISLPSFQGWMGKTDLRDAATRVADLMLKTRMRSVVTRSNHTVSVNYVLDEISVAPVVGAIKKTGSVDLSFDTADPECPPLSGNTVVFSPNGTADAAGYEAVYLKSRNPRVVERYRVKILGATGKVSVEKRAGGAWSGLN